MTNTEERIEKYGDDLLRILMRTEQMEKDLHHLSEVSADMVEKTYTVQTIQEELKKLRDSVHSLRNDMQKIMYTLNKAADETPMIGMGKRMECRKRESLDLQQRMTKLEQIVDRHTEQLTSLGEVAKTVASLDAKIDILQDNKNLIDRAKNFLLILGILALLGNSLGVLPHA